MRKLVPWVLLGVWFCLIQDREGNSLRIETKYEATCKYYQNTMRRLPGVTVTECTFLKNGKWETEIG